ncbi:MAG: vitamin K epoxide reductase family protein [Candidatus Eremiobacteraeota bacterium]|nr:vitamin K epoxide reductase family protein [Candidatus Eremiobacteraeota bacterium]
MLRKFAVAALAGTGLYVSQHMFRKSKRAERGELDEPSVVEKPAAHVLFGLPNSEFGLIYYGALLLVLPASGSKPVRRAMLAGSAAAFSMSLYLMYSLLFVSKAECPYCWTSHASNTLLFALLLAENRAAH